LELSRLSYLGAGSGRLQLLGLIRPLSYPNTQNRRVRPPTPTSCAADKTKHVIRDGFDATLELIVISQKLLTIMAGQMKAAQIIEVS
jgi:hypothetical protein